MIESDDLEAVELLLSTYETEPRIVRTLGEVAAHFGVQPQTVRTWRMESPPMPGVPGQYDLDQIEAWHNRRTTRNDVPGMIKLTIESQRAELARRLEGVRGQQMKNDRRTAQLIPRVEVVEDTSSTIAVLTNGLKQLPDRIAAAVPAELGEVIRHQVAETVSIASRALQNDLGETNV